MPFTFSIRKALRDSWEIFADRAGFFIGLTVITLILSFIGGGKKVPGIVSLIIFIASFVWSIIMMKISLAAADKTKRLLSFKALSELMPTFNQVLGLIGVAILSGLIVVGGFILLIIPGLYFAFRLSQSYLAYIDRSEGVQKALRYSWDMTKGPVFWTTVLVCIVSGLLNIIGVLIFGVGLLITYPLSMIFMALFYRALTHHHHGTTTVVIQPEEIRAPESSVVNV